MLKQYKYKKKLYLIQAVKEGVVPQKAMVKKDGNSRWWPRNGCDGRLVIKSLLMTIQVSLVLLGLGTKFT